LAPDAGARLKALLARPAFTIHRSAGRQFQRRPKTARP